MKALLLASLFLSLNALAAEKIHLYCSTPADALGLVTLYENNGKSMMKINYGEGDEEDVPGEVHTLTSSLKNIAAGDSDTLVGQKIGSENLMFGGGIGDAVLIRVLPGQQKAYLAAKNWVYYLNCFKPEK